MSDRPVRQWAKVTLTDGRVVEVGVDHRDFVAYDLSYQRRGWPKAEDAPFLLQQFIFANAIVRAGENDGQDVKAVLDRIALIDEEKPETVDPTGGAPGPDSS